MVTVPVPPLQAIDVVTAAEAVIYPAGLRLPYRKPAAAIVVSNTV